MRRTARLVGRARETAHFTEALDALAGDWQPVISLEGDPGIGKTRLLRELCGLAEGRGCLALSGRAAEFERGVPFGVFLDALDDYVGSLNPGRLERLESQARGELGAIFPSLAAGDHPSELGLGSERYRSHHAVRLLLETLASERPLVLALDDLHWGDEASVELLSYLLRHRPRAPVLLALAVRPYQAPPALGRVLEAAAREGAIERVELSPLTETEAAELLGEGVDARLRAELYGDSGGNPFYLEQLARMEHPTPARAASVLDPMERDVPAAVQAAIAEELTRLGREARELIEGAAVAGDPFELDLAAAAEGVAEGDALPALDELLESGLVHETDLPRRFRFRHPIVRRAVYESAGQGAKIAAHARAARALEVVGAAAPMRAHHTERSARVGDDDAIALLTEAARDVAPRAP
ncbi:MAG: ATP-binding protein, partial [Gaiellaceae bacterium]